MDQNQSPEERAVLIGQPLGTMQMEMGTVS